MMIEVFLSKERLLQKKEIAFIEIEATDDFDVMTIPYKGDELSIVVKLNIKYCDHMIIGMVEYDNNLR